MDFKMEIKEEPLFDAKEELIQQTFDIKCESDEDDNIQSPSSDCLVQLCTTEAPEHSCSSTGGALFNFKIEPQLESCASPTQAFIKSESTEGSFKEINTKMCNTVIESPEEKLGLCSGEKPTIIVCAEPSSPENGNKMKVLGHLIPVQVQELYLPPEMHPVDSVTDNKSNLREKSSEHCNSYFQCPENFNSIEESVEYPVDWVTELNVKEELQEQSHQCSECAEKFSSIDKLEDHMTFHTRCTTCFRNCDTAQELERHKTHHKKRRMVRCPNCRGEFYSKVSLKAHLRNAHTGYACAHCSKTFSTKRGVQKHWNVHFPQFPCPLCHKKFRHETQLKLHFAQRHSVKNPLYDCAHCTEKFEKIEDIKNHLKVHFKDNSYRANTVPVVQRNLRKK